MGSHITTRPRRAACTNSRSRSLRSSSLGKGGRSDFDSAIHQYRLCSLRRYTSSSSRWLTALERHPPARTTPGSTTLAAGSSALTVATPILPATCALGSVSADRSTEVLTGVPASSDRCGHGCVDHRHISTSTTSNTRSHMLFCYERS